MAWILIACVLLSCGLMSHGQLNYEGNPLTESIDYTAQESKSSRLNARRDYRDFEITDSVEGSNPVQKSPFSPSAIDPLLTALESDQLPHDNPNEAFRPTTTKENIFQNDELAGPPSSDVRVSTSVETRLQTQPIANTQIDSVTVESQSEARHLGPTFPVESSQPEISSPVFHQQTPRMLHSAIPFKPDRSFVMKNALETWSKPGSTIQSSAQSSLQGSDQALDQFLNSQTPQESEVALNNYLAMQRANGQEKNRQSPGENNLQVSLNGPSLNGPSTNSENWNSQQDPESSLPIGVLSSADQAIHASGQQYQSPMRWGQIGMMYPRRKPSYRTFPMRYPSRYRPPMRGNPWAQSRIGPPTIYQQNGAVFHGPPMGPWKQPIESAAPIHSTGFPNSVAHGPNPSVGPYEDASKWFHESDQLPPKKDIYYSQLYAQSYDPHYYNYIAKTGKIKPWLYGKLGKTEENSIWWELYTGFKKHGIKNMMNPMFLLGMTIPTLTLVLSALVQKRSMARANNGLYTPDEQLLDKYEAQIREAISRYEREFDEASENKRTSRALRDVDLKKKTSGQSAVDFQNYFLNSQREVAAALRAYEQQIPDKMMRPQPSKEQLRRRQGTFAQPETSAKPEPIATEPTEIPKLDIK